MCCIKLHISFFCHFRIHIFHGIRFFIIVINRRTIPGRYFRKRNLYFYRRTRFYFLSIDHKRNIKGSNAFNGFSFSLNRLLNRILHFCCHFHRSHYQFRIFRKVFFITQGNDHIDQGTLIVKANLFNCHRYCIFCDINHIFCNTGCRLSLHTFCLTDHFGSFRCRRNFCPLCSFRIFCLLRTLSTLCICDTDISTFRSNGNCISRQ